MTRIVFRTSEGKDHPVEVEPGTSLMLAAISNGLEGIVGECGGSAMCATCHVYIAEEDDSRVPPRAAIEDDMLESAADEVTERSRLGCQILVTSAMEGMIVQMPACQY
ncbi:2Fe-2S iron-sulfur cluster-binding protein [Oceanicola sp. S124]|uniref:2Fe-2S iron-sulfur cluster-binding protein n=1 Tax=Oceanicola sp. S124 TaxID=1042378 RepID=UPI000314F690|nr:2Fe-2S iron-sulfur cluster-binding protein [Oceanicola sp. S124]